MTISELKNTIREKIDTKHIDWIETENYIQQLGANINDVVDNEDTYLSDLYCYVHNGHDAVRLTELFLRYGYDVSMNNGFNGAACLHRLCYSIYDHYILHVAELLIDAGADCNIDIDEDVDSNEEPSGVLSVIEWKSGDWMTGEFYSANIFEAYYEMVNRKIQNKPYKGIRSFRDSVGKTVNKVLRLSYKDGNSMDSLPNAFDGGLVFVAEDVCFVAKPYTEYLINPYYADDDYIVEDVSDYYKEIIGVKIKGLRYESNSFATVSFENGKRLSFMSAWYDSEKKHKAGLCYIRTSKAGLKPYTGMVITEFLFTSGWNFSNECRVYRLSEIFLKISGKYYHVYSKGKNYGNHSLMIEEIPFEWAERLKRTIENKDVKIHSAGYIQDSLKWIEIKEQESYLYIRVDTFEKMYMYRSKERIEEPLEEGNYIFDKNLEKIDFIN